MRQVICLISTWKFAKFRYFAFILLPEEVTPHRLDIIIIKRIKSILDMMSHSSNTNYCMHQPATTNARDRTTLNWSLKINPFASHFTIHSINMKLCEAGKKTHQELIKKYSKQQTLYYTFPEIFIVWTFSLFTLIIRSKHCVFTLSIDIFVFCFVWTAIGRHFYFFYFFPAHLKCYGDRRLKEHFTT